MCGGGGSPPPIDYAAQANAQMRIIQEQARIAEQQRQQEYARQMEQEQRDLGIFNENLTNAITGARGQALDVFTTRGLDPNNYAAQIDQALNQARAQVPRLDANPASYINGQSIADMVLGNATTAARNQYSNQVNQFAANGFANNMVSSAADDAILEAILGEQYNPALEQIQRAFERGTLNEQGFQTAQNALGQQRSTAMAQLQNTGGGILEQLRQSLSGIGQEARTGASSYELGQTFDPNSYQSRIQSTYDEGINNLEGNIRNAIGGQQYFDIGSILSRGAVGQGTTAGGTRALFDTFQEDENDRNKQRGLGTQGVF